MKPKPVPFPPPKPTTSEPDPEPPKRALPFRGISLRPCDAVNPYRHGTLKPDRIGVHYMTIWCPFCDHSLEVVELTYVHEEGLLYINAICRFCIDKGGEGLGIYRRFVMPLPEGQLPFVHSGG